MFRKFCVVVCAVALSAALAGCATLVIGAVGGAGTAFWLSGKLSDTIDAPRDKVVEATKEALKSLKMDIRKEAVAKDVTQIISAYKDGSETWIDIRPVTSKSTKIEIRVGIRGNKIASQEILDRINKNVKGIF